MDRDLVELVEIDAGATAALIRDGKATAVETTEACLARIAEREPAVQAWTFLDPDHARAQARAAHEHRQAGRPLGPLHGVAVGIKDIIGTADMPTEDGTVLHAGRQPRHDAALVARLRAAGAVILGKTVTTELAVYSPGKTRNPHDPERTPGGSSSGSAAAVAAGMVPLAVGTQTNGSVIRPAAFCGVYGFKPSFGRIGRAGVLRQSPPLDHVGVFARSVADLALISEVLMGHDPDDPATRPAARPPLFAVAAEPPPVLPTLAFVRTPVWRQAEPQVHAAFDELVQALGERVQEVTLPADFERAHEAHRLVMEADLATNFAAEYERGRDKLSAVLREMIERGQKVTAVQYHQALALRDRLNAELDELFSAFDGIVTPATAGEAPLGLQSTGSPAFCTIWTLCGVPAVSLPLMTGEAGMPLAVQLVGAAGDDARLLRLANWLTKTVAAPARRKRRRS
jgi:Asp-tRNA(Asn)/Glu-tRNA(Gln) amidotransferase A subunit family amidase